MMKFLFVAAVFAGLAGAVRADDSQPVISGEELRRILSGNTVWVIRQDLSIGDEYHLPDGRVYGFNGVETIENGCWDIVGDQVCYYYKDDYAKGRAHCWTFRRAGVDLYYLRGALGDRGIGRREDGNPRNYSHNGKPWECRRLLS